MAKPHLTAEQTVASGIRLLEALSAAPGQTLAVGGACELLACTNAELEQIVDTLSTLSSRSSGARAAITIADGRVTLHGDAALIMPRRFSLEEGMVLAHILDVLDLDDETRERIRAAVGPAQGAMSAPGIVEPARYGSCFARLSEAIEDGIRCTMTYRSLTEGTARTRTIDPLEIQEEHGEVYLVAWDIEKDAERRYRLDRVGEVTFTEDSVEHHGVLSHSASESLRAQGLVARLVLRPGARTFLLDWAGVADIEPHEDGSMAFSLYYSSESWLFDQVLAAAGELELIEPAELRERLVAYGANLRA